VQIAQACVDCGVSRLVFLSSASVYGGPGHDGVITTDTPVSPSSEYGRQKVFAEDEIQSTLERAGDTHAFVLRPPMVYGPNAPGNFSRLAALLKYGVPLPRGLVDVRRSFIYCGNLADLVVHCIGAELSGVTSTHLATDGPAVDLESFIKRMSAAIRKPRFWLPLRLCRGLAKVPALRSKLGPLTSDFVMDAARTEQSLGWRPPYSWDEGLALSLREPDGA
jgi:nucleoside-diphosphate-sugar epimerase